MMSAQDAANLYDTPSRTGGAATIAAGGAAGITGKDWPSVRQEIITTVKAAAMGDQQATARLRAIAEMMGERLPAWTLASCRILPIFRLHDTATRLPSSD